MNLPVNGCSKVPPGFRFHPTEQELLQYYLKKKLAFDTVDLDVIREIDLNKLEPWEIQETCRIGSGQQNDWYFFSHKEKKYPTGIRTNRATAAGFWKATGRDKTIYSNNERIGMRKTLIFYKGRASDGKKSDWIMHEYRLEDFRATCTVERDHSSATRDDTDIADEGWVICRVFEKNKYRKANDMSTTSLPMGYDHSFSCMGKSHQDAENQAHPTTRTTTTTTTTNIFSMKNPPNTSHGRLNILDNDVIKPPNNKLDINSQLLSTDDYQYSLPMLNISSQPPFNHHNDNDPNVDLCNDNQRLHSAKSRLSDWKTLDQFIASELNGQDEELMMSLPMLTSSGPQSFNLHDEDDCIIDQFFDNQRLDDPKPRLSDWISFDQFIASQLNSQNEDLMMCSNSVSLPMLSPSSFNHHYEDDPIFDQRLDIAKPRFSDGMTVDRFIASELDEELMVGSNSVSLPTLTSRSTSTPPFSHHHDDDISIDLGYDNRRIDTAKTRFSDWMTLDRFIASQLND